MTVDSQYGDSAPKRKSAGYGLSAKQSECLDILRREIARTGVAPSYDEIKARLGLRSKSGVHRLIHALRDKGKIQFLNYRARSIALVEEKVSVAEALERVLATCHLSRHTKSELAALLEGEK